MKKEVRNHSIPLVAIFLVTSLVWILSKVPYYQFIFLFLGLFVGSIFLDLDHVIYWLYTRPNLEESRLFQAALKKRDFKAILVLFSATHKNHNNLIFHHYFSQIILALISFFVFTSSNNIFTMAFILALNIHLLVDEIVDYLENPKHLQDWLFARESKQLPLRYLKHFLIAFILISLIFAFMLVKSVI